MSACCSGAPVRFCPACFADPFFGLRNFLGRFRCGPPKASAASQGRRAPFASLRHFRNDSERLAAGGMPAAPSRVTRRLPFASLMGKLPLAREKHQCRKIGNSFRTWTSNDCDRHRLLADNLYRFGGNRQLLEDRANALLSLFSSSFKVDVPGCRCTYARVVSNWLTLSSWSQRVRCGIPSP